MARVKVCVQKRGEKLGSAAVPHDATPIAKRGLASSMLAPLVLILIVPLLLVPSQASARGSSVWTFDPSIIFGYSFGLSTISPAPSKPLSGIKELKINGLPSPPGLHLQSFIQYRFNRVLGFGLDFGRYSSGRLMLSSLQASGSYENLLFTETFTNFEGYMYGYLPLSSNIDFFSALGLALIIPDLTVYVVNADFTEFLFPDPIVTTTKDEVGLVFKSGIDVEIATNTYITTYVKIFHDLKMDIVVAGRVVDLKGAGVVAVGMGGMFKF